MTFLGPLDLVMHEVLLLEQAVLAHPAAFTRSTGGRPRAEPAVAGQRPHTAEALRRHKCRTGWVGSLSGQQAGPARQPSIRWAATGAFSLPVGRKELVFSLSSGNVEAGR